VGIGALGLVLAAAVLQAVWNLAAKGVTEDRLLFIWLYAVLSVLVWVPVAIFLFVTGHPTRGFIELVWCSLTVIALSDYVIRPRLVGDDETPEILTFIALFGGLELFGLSGLVVGPILMSVAVATLRLYVRETADDERPATKAASQFR